jgi:hypothetical protein
MVAMSLYVIVRLIETALLEFGGVSPGSSLYAIYVSDLIEFGVGFDIVGMLLLGLIAAMMGLGCWAITVYFRCAASVIPLFVFFWLKVCELEK